MRRATHRRHRPAGSPSPSRRGPECPSSHARGARTHLRGRARPHRADRGRPGARRAVAERRPGQVRGRRQAPPLLLRPPRTGRGARSPSSPEPTTRASPPPPPSTPPRPRPANPAPPRPPTEPLKRIGLRSSLPTLVAGRLIHRNNPIQSAQPYFTRQSFGGSRVDFRGPNVHNDLAFVVVRGRKTCLDVRPAAVRGTGVLPLARGSG